MNILHLVLGCKNDHYANIKKAAKETWLKDQPDNIKTIFLYGNSDKIYWDSNDSFYVDAQENLSLCLYKTVVAYETFLDSNFDYIFRSNCTGYFDYRLINKFIHTKSKNNFYCGCIGYYNNICFASGSGYFLSKDLVTEIVKNKSDLYTYNIPEPYGQYDDVVIGKFITENLKIPIDLSARRLDISDSDINDNLDMTHYHYRILFKGSANALYKIHELKTKNDNYSR